MTLENCQDQFNRIYTNKLLTPDRHSNFDPFNNKFIDFNQLYTKKIAGDSVSF